MGEWVSGWMNKWMVMGGWWMSEWIGGCIDG